MYGLGCRVSGVGSRIQSLGSMVWVFSDTLHLGP